MADQLTSAQRLAVERSGGPILVSAAAGSGKTKVLVERLIRQITRPDDPCDINDFLIITFTKKAAAELRTRIASALAEQLAEHPDNLHLQRQQSRIYLTQISTVHSFCGDLLREFAYELELPADFRMLEETESDVLRQQIADDLLEERYESIDQDPALQKLINGLGAGRDDRRIASLILDVFRTVQCHLHPDQWLKSCAEQLSVSALTRAEDTVWGEYLITCFHRMLEEQLSSLRSALEQIRQSDALQKYVPCYEEHVGLLEQLEQGNTWDDIHEAMTRGIQLRRLPPIRDCGDPELQARVKLAREQARDAVKDWIPEFYGDSERVLTDLRQTSEALLALFALTEDFGARYQREKLRLHALDFNDLEHEAVRLLLEKDNTPTPIASRIAQRYREILVDEYQDTNEVQDSLFRAISRDGKNRFMVGDVKQSIYRFRLADPTIFLDKYNRYPDAQTVESDARQRILLSDNFRSAPGILEAVNAVFYSCMSEQVGGLDYGPAEALRSGRAELKLPYPQVELHCISTKQEGEEDTPEKNRTEAEFVANRIRQLLDERLPVREGKELCPIRPKHIAILLRSPKNSAGLYLDALRARGVPAVSDSGESILDSAEVETLLCLLKVLDNVRRDVPLAGAMLSPIFGLTGTELSRARNIGEDQGLYDAMCRLRQQSPAIDSALKLLDELREAARELPLHRLLERINQRTALEAVYGAMADGSKRRSNLQQFFQLAAAFAEDGRKSLTQFLKYIETLRAKGGVSAQSTQTDSVTVMSIHKSKGLEYPVVFLSGLSRGFNREDQKTQVQFHGKLGAGSTVYDPLTHTRYSSIARSAIGRQIQAENLSEELRILYVAMTRPQDLLIMTCCSNRLDEKLQSLAQSLTPDNSRRIAAGAGSLGDWILQTALMRTEAGELHARGGRPNGVKVSDMPWVIRYQAADNQRAEGNGKETAAAHVEPPLAPEQIEAGLRFVYPWTASVGVPSKLTATQLKGRWLDEEAADGRPDRKRPHPRLRRPTLMHAEKPLTPTQKGTAVHLAMQYLDFSRTDSLEAVCAQLEQMVEDQFLTRQQADAVAPEKLLRVFQGSLGREIREADQVIREFKFSILTDAGQYVSEARGEQMMVQGVTDCCLIKDGAMTVIDFKTDRVLPGHEAEVKERYRGQLETYSMALSRIFGLSVRKKLLYFFATDTAVEL